MNRPRVYLARISRVVFYHRPYQLVRTPDGWKTIPPFRRVFDRSPWILASIDGRLIRCAVCPCSSSIPTAVALAYSRGPWHRV